MRKRKFLRKLCRYVGMGFFVFVGNLTLSSFLLKNKEENENSTGPFYYGFKCISKKYPNKVYKTTFEFWEDHPDEISTELNKFFSKKGWLITSRSSFSKEGKEILFEKYYKTRFHSELYTRLWTKFSYGKLKEYENVTYTLFKRGKESIHCPV